MKSLDLSFLSSLKASELNEVDRLLLSRARASGKGHLLERSDFLDFTLDTYSSFARASAQYLIKRKDPGSNLKKAVRQFREASLLTLLYAPPSRKTLAKSTQNRAQLKFLVRKEFGPGQRFNDSEGLGVALQAMRPNRLAEHLYSSLEVFALGQRSSVQGKKGSGILMNNDIFEMGLNLKLLYEVNFWEGAFGVVAMAYGGAAFRLTLPHFTEAGRQLRQSCGNVKDHPPLLIDGEEVHLQDILINDENPDPRHVSSDSSGRATYKGDVISGQKVFVNGVDKTGANVLLNPALETYAMCKVDEALPMSVQFSYLYGLGMGLNFLDLLTLSASYQIQTLSDDDQHYSPSGDVKSFLFSVGAFF